MNTATMTNGHVETAPVNGMPSSLIEIVQHEAIGFRAWGTPEGDFLASQMDRLAQLIRWTGTTTPDAHQSRMEVWDAEIAERHFDRGYTEGYEAGRRSARGYDRD